MAANLRARRTAEYRSKYLPVELWARTTGYPPPTQVVAIDEGEGS